MQLNAFRAQWMSELKPSSGATGTSDRLLRAKSLKKTQETAREEKVSSCIVECFLRVFTSVHLHAADD